jgi:hypothetical protein
LGGAATPPYQWEVNGEAFQIQPELGCRKKIRRANPANFVFDYLNPRVMAD